MPVVDHVAVIGGGIMGGGIGQALLQYGYEVTIRDVDEEINNETRGRIISGNYGLDRAVEGGYLTEDEKADCLDRLSFTVDIDEAVAGTDMVIEAVPEDLLLKGRVFRQLDEATAADVPLYSNTSGFPIAALANAVEDPSRVAGTHFFNPAQIMNLVEVVRTPETDDSVVDLAEAVFEDIDKTAIVCEDQPDEYGFVVNRAWGAMREEARKIVDEGIVSAEELNLAMREGRNLPVGPLEGAGIGEEWD